MGGRRPVMTSKRVQIQLQPAVLRWARERAGLSAEELAAKFKLKLERVEGWEQSGEISFAQAERLAHATHTPFGYLFLASPPVESLPIPDFRTRSNEPPDRPSPNLLETVYSMQRRQEWMRDELISSSADPLDFVAAYDYQSHSKTVADAMRSVLSLKNEWAAERSTWSEALNDLIHRIDAVQVMIVSNGVVGNNTHRKLDPEEFQGFALVDEYAPLIFINNADYKAAQMFTVAHELAHVFIGEEGISILKKIQPSGHDVEQTCNMIAAEFLLPESSLREYWPKASDNEDPYQQIARRFKISPIVAARRAMDLDLIPRPEFFAYYEQYMSEHEERTKAAGGNFWNTQNVRISPLFSSAIIRAVQEGRLLYRDAYALTGLRGNSFADLMARSGN